MLTSSYHKKEILSSFTTLADITYPAQGVIASLDAGIFYGVRDNG